MSRRRGQNGHLEEQGKWWYVRFYIDVPGQEKRKRASVRVCPSSGEGKLGKAERQRRAREIIRESGADSPEVFWAAREVNSGITFRQQAERWLEHMRTRKRKPVKPATLAGWESCLNKRLLNELGDVLLADLNNQVVKNLVAKMLDEGLKSKTVREHFCVVRSVVASAIRTDGEQMFPRRWNYDYIDLPLIRNQRCPCFTSEIVSQILQRSKGWHRVLFALLAGTGLRIGEALGLEIKHLSSDRRVIRVEQSVWRGNVQAPKTPYAVREVDVAEELAEMLRQFIGSRQEGFLFRGRGNNPISSQSDILRQVLHPILAGLRQEKAGFHSFRRFRVTHLRKNRVPDSLIQYWIGHSPKTVTDKYTKISDELHFRRECAEQVALGFEIPAVGGTQIDVLDVLDERREAKPVA